MRNDFIVAFSSQSVSTGIPCRCAYVVGGYIVRELNANAIRTPYNCHCAIVAIQVDTRLSHWASGPVGQYGKALGSVTPSLEQISLQAHLDLWQPAHLRGLAYKEHE